MHVQSCPTLQSDGLSSATLLCPWDSLGKNTGVGCHALQGDLSHPGIEPASLTSPALAGGFFTISAALNAYHVPNAGETGELNSLCPGGTGSIT